MGICGRCKRELRPTEMACGCNAEEVKRNIKIQRIKHLETWIKQLHKQIVHQTKRIKDMEEELKNI